MLHEVWTCSTHGHTIEIKSRWLGFKEVIYYDGREVASGLTVFGGRYHFRVEEDGQPVNYNVKLQTTVEGIEITVTRNDETVHSQTTQ